MWLGLLRKRRSGIIIILGLLNGLDLDGLSGSDAWARSSKSAAEYPAFMVRFVRLVVLNWVSDLGRRF